MSKPDTWYSTGQPQATLESEFLASLSKNQKVIWNGRANPLTVVGESFGSHVMVEGPNGAIYRIEPNGEGDFRLAYRGGTVDNFRLVADIGGGK